MDEIGLTTVQNLKKVITHKGVKQLNQCTSGEREQLVTFLVGISGAGTFIPPVIIFVEKNFKQHMINGAPIVNTWPSKFIRMDDNRNVWFLLWNIS